MSPLDRKLLRDLWRIKGQAIAIGTVIGVGVLMLVMMTGLVTSLDETRKTYYERYRLADIFAPVTRAPNRLIADLAAIPGVSRSEEHSSELQSRPHLVCRLLLEKKNKEEPTEPHQPHIP